jgi:hypothetical protein
MVGMAVLESVGDEVVRVRGEVVGVRRKVGGGEILAAISLSGERV